MKTTTPKRTRQRGGWILAALALLPAVAQSEEAVTIEHLRDELAERDKIIIDLMHRVEALESRLSADDDRTALGSEDEKNEELEREPQVARRSPTGMEIDELAAERALERSLVQQGVRLLGPGQMEVDFGSTYSRNETRQPTLATIAGDSFVAEIARRADAFDSVAALRLGLPFDTQLEVSIPYRSLDTSTELRIDGAVESTIDRSASGPADVKVGLVTLLAEESAWRPNLVGRLEWLTGTGKRRDDGLSLGAGNKALSARLSASWRRDPVVFLLGGGYTRYYDAEPDELQPGDRLDLSLGAALAVSPESALIFSIDQSSSGEFELGGVTLPGSDRRSSVFNVSTSTIVGRGVLLRLNAGIGLTEDAPDYQLGVSLPIRTDIFGR